MKLKISVLLLIPILLISTELNQGKIIRTKDQGAFKLYRSIGIRAREVSGDVVVWGLEGSAEIKGLVANPSAGLLYAMLPDRDAVFYKRSVPDNAAELIPIPSNIRRPVNDLFTHSSGLYIASEGGLYRSEAWTNQKVKGPVFNVCVSPPNSADYLTYADNPEGVYKVSKSPWIPNSLLPFILGVEDFESVFEDTIIHDSLPEGWEIGGIESEYRWVSLDTSEAIGNYSLLIQDEGLGGAAVWVTKTLPSLKNFTTCFDIKVSGFSSATTGPVVIKSGLVLAEVRMSEGVLQFYDGTEWSEVKGGTYKPDWNNLAVEFVPSEDIFILSTNGDVADTLPLMSSSDSITSYAKFETQSAQMSGNSYWIDNFSLKPKVLDLAPHYSNKEEVLALTYSGVYQFVDSTSNWVNVFDVPGNWKSLKTAFTKGKYYVLFSWDGNSSLVYRGDTNWNWSEITGDLANLKINDVSIDTLGTVFAATDSNYVYRRGISESSWTQLTEGFDEYGVSTYAKRATSIAVYTTGDSVFSATYSGLYFSEDNGNSWVEKNEVLDPASVELTDSLIGIVDSLWEESTPNDPNAGLVDAVTEGLGEVPDVDNNHQINVVLLDIEDLTAGGTEDWCYSYFDPENEYDISEDHPNSNEGEYIYVDYPLFSDDPEKAIVENAKSLAKMISWNYDPNEEEWLLSGFGSYASYLTEYGEGNTIPDSEDYYVCFPNGLSGLFFSPVEDENYPYLLMMYLYSEYGSGFIRTLDSIKGSYIINLQTGETATRPMKGMESIDSTLVRVGESGDVIDLFIQFIKTCYRNELKYGPTIGYSPDPVTTIKGFKKIPLTDNLIATDTTNNIRYYGAWVYRMTHEFATSLNCDSIIFNGEKACDFYLYLASRKDDSIVKEVSIDTAELGEDNRYVIDVSDVKDGTYDMTDIVLITISTKGSNPIYGFSNFIVKYTPPKIDKSVFQAPLADKFMRIYLYSDQRLYKDINKENPQVIFGEDTVDMVYSETLENGNFVYLSDIRLQESGEQEINIGARDVAGAFHLETLSITVKKIGQEGGVIANKDAEVEIPSGSIGSMKRVTLGKIGDAWYVGPTMGLKKEATIRIPCKNYGKDAGLYQKDGTEWKAVESRLISGHLEAKIKALGTFKILDRQPETVDEAPRKFYLKQNSPNPFNRVTQIEFGIPKDSKVRLDIFNVVGQRVNTLLNKSLDPGYYPVKWNGKDAYGEEVKSGIYFYRLKTEEKTLTKKMVFIR
ncbi:MAG: T9SS type A sorting domain-containing protein [candidate division WOR-3 bacterium]|nr:T9SS type A sorting domain-containing protein [candidate division WOR-3 bacterium]